MTVEAAEHLRAGLRDLRQALPDGWYHTSDRLDELEYFARLPQGTLEVEAGDDFASLALDSALLEDLPLKSIRDADRVLAACDAVLAGRVKEVRSEGWPISKAVTVFRLNTRGFDESIQDQTLKMSFGPSTK